MSNDVDARKDVDAPDETTDADAVTDSAATPEQDVLGEESAADPAAEESDAAQDAADEEADEEDGTEGNEAPARRRSAKATALEEEGDIAADYLEELLNIADLDGDIDIFTEGGRAHVSIVTSGDQLVGKDGEVLEALQELARLAVMTETGKRSRLMLDVAGHRDRRRRELTDLAKDAIEEVKESGEAARLAPMNPFERKIVHDVVAEAGLTSESEGEEPKRRVVILPS